MPTHSGRHLKSMRVDQQIAEIEHAQVGVGSSHAVTARRKSSTSSKALQYDWAGACPSRIDQWSGTESGNAYHVCNLLRHW